MRLFLPFLASALFLVFSVGVGCAAPQAPPSIDLIPAPSSIAIGDGVFRLGDETVVDVQAPELAAGVERQVASLRRSTRLPLAEGAAGDDSTIRVVAQPSVPDEGYTLRITPAEVLVEASTDAGVFYAFQTVRQLLPPDVESTTPVDDVDWILPSVVIEDAPRFAYRGMHLDVGRHFFDVDVVKAYVDTMARFKINRFHWHLTEDQGWRIEIDAYPRLTEVGAWRAESPVEDNLDPYVGDGERHGGFYTKDEVRDVVAYAAERFVTVVPEIELPGHATAALAAYPELGCTDATLDVSTTWGIHDTIFCPKEATFEFLETVLSEVMELFPSELIHIGGDEVPKRQWEESEQAQAVMRREGLADEDELQSWFTRRIERHLRANGRQLIGWDETLEGGLAPGAMVMSWRGIEGGIAAARQGHDVVMTPVEHAYFDFYQGDAASEPLAMNWAGFAIPLETVYAFEPLPDVLTDTEAQHIVGAQGNVWTEYIPTAEHLEYMAYPRALALAEVAWSSRATRDWETFVERLPGVLAHLDALAVRYRFPEEVLGSGERSGENPGGMQ